MPRSVKALGWALVAWTVALATATAVVGLTGGCGDVAASDLHVCELDRDSTVSGLALIWFIGALPLGIALLIARGRRARCRICRDELSAGERSVCRRCAGRLVSTAEPRPPDAR